MNLPICAVVLLGTRVFLSPSRAERPRRLDAAGAALSVLALSAVLVPAALGQTLEWPAWTLACLLCGLIAVGLLVSHVRATQRRGGHPIIAPRLFTRPEFALSIGLAVLFFAGNAGLFLILTYHLQAGLSLSPLDTGLVFTPLGAGFALTSAASRRLASRVGIRLAVAGAGLMAVSLCAVPIATGTGGAQPWLLAAMLAVSGVGQGLVVVPMVATILAAVPRGESGSGSGVYGTFAQAGMATGVAVLGAVYRGILGANPETHAPALTPGRFRGAFDTSALLLAAVAVIVGLLAARIAAITERPR